MISSSDGSSSGNQHILDNLSNYKGIIGKIGDVVSCPKPLIGAFSVALGKYSEYLVVDTIDNANKIINTLKSKNFSFNFIILDLVVELNKKDKNSSNLLLNNRV